MVALSSIIRPLANKPSANQPSAIKPIVDKSRIEAHDRSIAALREMFLQRTSRTAPSRISKSPRLGEAVVVRDADGEILHVQVSRWRRVSAGPRRRIADVVRFNSGEAAILIEKTTGASSVWQVYDLDGHLDALLQCSADGQFGVLLDYCVGDVSRLAYQPGRGMHIVETRPL